MNLSSVCSSLSQQLLAVEDILTRLHNIDHLEKANTPIQSPSRPLISHYREMLSYNFNTKTMDEIAASTESRMIVCSPEEAFSLADLQIFENHIEEIVTQRKSAVMSGIHPTESEMRLTTFLKELSTQENASIQLEQSFVFTDMYLLNPDSGFSLFGALSHQWYLFASHIHSLKNTN